jgi:hypothetical protein
MGSIPEVREPMSLWVPNFAESAHKRRDFVGGKPETATVYKPYRGGLIRVNFNADNGIRVDDVIADLKELQFRKSVTIPLQRGVSAVAQASIVTLFCEVCLDDLKSQIKLENLPD